MIAAVEVAVLEQNDYFAVDSRRLRLSPDTVRRKKRRNCSVGLNTAKKERSPAVLIENFEQTNRRMRKFAVSQYTIEADDGSKTTEAKD